MDFHEIFRMLQNTEHLDFGGGHLRYFFFTRKEPKLSKVSNGNDCSQQTLKFYIFWILCSADQDGFIMWILLSQLYFVL